MFKKIILLFVAALAVTACHKSPSNKPSMALFVEQETDVDPYKTRVIATKDYLRMDEGVDGNDFVLLDRKQQQIYSVRSDNRTIMTIAVKKVDVESPIPLKISNDRVTSTKDVPQINGKTPEHYAFSVNDKVCYEAFIVKDMLPDMVKAMYEFALILAGDSTVTFNSIPADVRNACDMANNTFAPSRHLKLGFPVQEWKPGYSRTLLEYHEDYQVDPKLFELPKDYFQFSVQDFREGKVKLPD
jgi:hypothetical protein